MSFQEREELLLSWTMKSCSDNSSISLEEGWDILDRFGLRMIQEYFVGDDIAVKPMGTKAFTSLYTIAYKLSTTATMGVTDFSKVLYTRSINSVKNFVELNILSKLEDKSGAAFLSVFAEGWRKHKLLTTWMWRLFMNLDKTVVRTEGLPTITSCYLKYFYDFVFLSHLDTLRQCMLDCAAANREAPLGSDYSVFQEVVQVEANLIVQLCIKNDNRKLTESAVKYVAVMYCYLCRFMASTTFLIDVFLFSSSNLEAGLHRDGCGIH